MMAHYCIDSSFNNQTTYKKQCYNPSGNCKCYKPCPCPPKPPVDCDTILKRFHDLVSKSICLNNESEKILIEVFEQLSIALASLENALELSEKSSTLFSDALILLMRSGCSGCNIDDPCCQKLLNQTTQYSQCGDKFAKEAYGLLEETLNRLETSIAYEKQSDALRDKAIKCIHTPSTNSYCNDDCGCSQ